MKLTEETLAPILTHLKKNDFKFYQFYNAELETNESSFIDYMLKYKDNNIPKLLNKTYYDIETFVPESGEFTDAEAVDYPINAIAIYNTITNTCYVISFVTECNLTDPVEIKKQVLEVFNEKVKENPVYDVSGITVEVIITENEEELLIRFFTLLKELNTLMLIGFNSSNFDDPYIFNRSIKLFGEDRAKKIISEFGILNKYGMGTFELPDYLLVDLQKHYKPVGEGGGGLGKSLPNYKLNTIAKKELNITKLDLPGGFRFNYLNNIVNYLAYNIFDTILTFKIDEKMRFMELLFELSKYNTSTMGATINGRSFIYLYRNDLIYSSQNKIIRVKKFSREVLFETSSK